MKTFTALTKEVVLSMGFTQNDIDNATYQEDYLVLPDARIHTDFNTLIEYKVINNVLYIDEIYIIHNDVKITYAFNSNMKYGYRFFINNFHRTQNPITYDENKFKYNGNKILKYNKNNIQTFIDAVANDYKFFFNCLNDAVNKLTQIKTEFENRGFKFYSDSQAYFKNDLIDIEITILQNGSFTSKITERPRNTIETRLNLIDNLINLK